MKPESKDGTCPFKRDDNHDCCGNRINGPIVCAWVVESHERGKHCNRYYREASLTNIKPTSFCCKEMENLFHDCTEDSGYMAGGFNLRKYPNDGKDVWRNYSRVKFRFCPFCGKEQGRDQCG